MQHFMEFCKKEAVTLIAGLLAFASCFVIPPSAEYMGYINWSVLALLFCLMTVSAGLRAAGAFDWLCGKLLRVCRTELGTELSLEILCFFLAMLLTNDVTLVTVVPFTLLVWRKMRAASGSLIRTLVMETVAANLGSMLTPFGNPQNLYLYSAYGFSIADFLRVMFPYAAASFALILAATVGMAKGEKERQGQQDQGQETAVSSGGEVKEGISGEMGRGARIPERRPDHWKGTGNETTDEAPPMDHRKIALYTALFAFAVLSVIHVVSTPVMFAVITLAVLLSDRALFRTVDYSLLLTFVFFFVFIGNIGKVPSFSAWLSGVMQGREMICAILASQVISNVPAALLLSGFTADGTSLLIGTNLGGLGTLIASMASLITYKLYAAEQDAETGRYFALFTAVNVFFLLILTGLALFLK